MKQQVNTFLLKSNKKCFILILLVPLLLSNFLPNTFQLILAQTNSVENINEYENSIFGLSIDYPSNWIIDEFEKRIKNDETVGINNIVLFCPTPATLKSTPSNQMNTNTTTTLCENAEKSFDIYVHNLPAGMTLEEFTNSKISSYKLELTDFKIIESNPSVTIDNNPAYKLTYTYTDKINDKKIQVMEVWTVIEDDDSDDHAGKAYSLRYEAIPIEFPIYLNTANNTISSFEFQNIDNDESDN
ncbi:MAG: hypothetical protein QOK71_01420 [Nitrososphaeraceae archaeon]|nr:hypothetical protein [Nitrososphaeraceae archaeon]